MTQRVDKSAMACNKPRRTPGHPEKSHIVKACYDGKEKIIRFGEQGASTAGKPKAGESERMTKKRASFKARHAKNIAKGPSSAAYWANRVKWAEGGPVELKEGGQPPRKRQTQPGFLDYLRSVGGTLTSLPNLPGAIYDLGEKAGRAIPQAAESALQYIQRNTPRQVVRDVRGGLSKAWRHVSDNPVSSALDVIPVVGDIKAYGEDVRDAARRRAVGDLAGAYNIEQFALPMAMASILPGVGEARKAGKAARAAEEAADVARAAERVAPRTVKVEGRELPVIYRGSNVDPMETHAKSRAAWFSSSPEVASSYATSPEGSRVTPMVLNVEDPLFDILDIDAGGKGFDEIDPYDVADSEQMEDLARKYDIYPGEPISTDKIAQLASDWGYKGVRIRNVVDPGFGQEFKTGQGLGDTYAILDPSILKPAIPYMGAPKPTIDVADDIKQLTRRLTANPERSVSSGSTRVGESTPGNMLDFMLGHGAVTEPVVERLPPFPKPKQLGPRHYSNQDLAELGLNMENAKLNFAKEMVEQEGIPLEEALKMAQEEAIVEDWSSVLPRTSDVDTWSGKLLYRGIPRVGENNLTTLSGLHAKERGMTDLPGHVAANTGNYAWASDNPRLAETYTHQGGVMVPLRLVREPDLVFDAQNQMWSDFFYPGQQWYDSSSPVNVDPIFEKAMKDPDVKSILVKNVIDPGSETNKSQFLNRWARDTHGVDWKDLTDDQKSDLYGSSGLMANNLLIKDPSVVEYAITRKTPKWAEGGFVNYDPNRVEQLANQLREEMYG